ncbi:MAG: hypothetical protein RBS34_15080 [Desulfofustis sp.]|nr:hypothetical protein [Desulfofustis sp.]
MSLAERQDPVDYDGLLAALQSAERSTTFIPFTEFVKDPENSDHPACMDYLGKNPGLIEQIRDDLGCEEIRWQLQGIDYRLLYVPEDRPEIAGPFIAYSQAVIGDLLARTGLDNPYHSIATQMEREGKLAAGERIRAVVVQDLAREYNARYHFTGTTEKTISIGLSGQSSIDEVGSYSSYLHYDEATGDYRFSRDRLTIWKTGAANPYTVLMTPLEETLHIALRDATEQAIRRSLKQRGNPVSMEETKVVVEQWLALEEAVAGGIVHHLAPEIIMARLPGLKKDLIQADLAVKAGYEKYRLLPNAIALLAEIGVAPVVERYRSSPEDLNKLLKNAPEERVDRPVEQR